MATPSGTRIPEGGSAIMPNGTPISCDFKGGCTYSIDGSGASMTGQADPSKTSTPSGGPPMWLPFALLPVIFGGAMYYAATKNHSKSINAPLNSSANSSANASANAPMPPTIRTSQSSERGGRRHSRRKHHSKNKTRRA